MAVASAKPCEFIRFGPGTCLSKLDSVPKIHMGSLGAVLTMPARSTCVAALWLG